MAMESNRVRLAAAQAIQNAALPTVVDCGEFEAQLNRLRLREKEHTHEGDAIAAERRRLPMVEVNPTTALIGSSGPVTLLDAFEGRQQLIAYYFMWHKGQPAQAQCQGCTWVTAHMGELSYFHARDVTFAVFAQGPYEESVRYGICRGTPRWDHWRRCWQVDASEGCTWCAICGMDQEYLRRTGRPRAAWK